MGEFKSSHKDTSLLFGNWLGDIMIYIVGAVAAIIALAYDPFHFVEKFPKAPQLGVGLLYFLLVLIAFFILIWFFFFMKRCLCGYGRARDPFIKVKETGTLKNPIVDMQYNEKGEKEIVNRIDVDFIYVHFINDPKIIAPESMAKEITAVVTL